MTNFVKKNKVLFHLLMAMINKVNKKENKSTLD
jgi:hypothetical protein